MSGPYIARERSSCPGKARNSLNGPVLAICRKEALIVSRVKGNCKLPSKCAYVLTGTASFENRSLQWMQYILGENWAPVSAFSRENGRHLPIKSCTCMNRKALGRTLMGNSKCFSVDTALIVSSKRAQRNLIFNHALTNDAAVFCYLYC